MMDVAGCHQARLFARLPSHVHFLSHDHDHEYEKVLNKDGKYRDTEEQGKHMCSLKHPYR